MKPLSGFRDLLPPDFARRHYITTQWRDVARRYGFVEFDGPMLESAELYQKKNSGGEILTQLYQFTDRGERVLALRPEMTPTLARMVAAHHRSFSKPLRWFNIGSSFRYERQQRGRWREFTQWNCDLLGEQSVAADAEIIGLLIDALRSFGLGPNDVVIRLSDRLAWQEFLQKHHVPFERMGEFLGIIDKMEREPREKTEEKLAAFDGLSFELLQEFLASPEVPILAPLLEELSARGLRDYVRPDLSIVRGLAYYTGIVFEAFALHGGLRAVAGGGRYDQLIEHLSDGAVSLPAVGFGMGDAVLLELLQLVPQAAKQEQSWMERHHPCDIYLVIAAQEHRPMAMAVAQQLRHEGWGVLFSLTPERVGKQFSAAEQTKARFAVVVGEEWPQVKVKNLSTREEVILPQEELNNWLNLKT
ncbi:MAG: histidine--tRNA ligase [Chthoniobacterales bacterium]|nr:histidine--tRNA ligase [Chthoniobacterales bacterium]